MLLPPDIATPFRNSEERAKARDRLEARDQTIRAIADLASISPDRWTSATHAVFPDRFNGVPDPASDRLNRWMNLFSEEIDEVHHIATCEHPLGDVEVKQALYLAARLLATVTDRTIDDVDKIDLDDEGLPH